jgi:voltage-gated sodium channel
MNDRSDQAAPPSGLRALAVRWTESARFQTTIMTLIVLNAVILGLETFPEVMQRAGVWLLRADAALLAIFVVELLLKLIAQGARFFRSPWNLFDTVIIGIALLPTGGPLAVLRALRVLRVMRLVSAVPRMRAVVEALVQSLPGLGSIAMLLLIFFYVFSVMATKLFSAEFPQWFGSLWGSMFSLFQIMTLEGWAEIARAIMVSHPLAWIFFMTFILLATFTVLNLFIAVIVNAMQQPALAAADNAAAAAATRQDVEALRAEIEALRRDLAARDAGRHG